MEQVQTQKQVQIPSILSLGKAVLRTYRHWKLERSLAKASQEISEGGGVEVKSGKDFLSLIR